MSAPRKKVSREHGVALLMVLIGLALLALMAQEMRYNSIVELRLATNQRDELRAHYMAKSSLGLARLMLRFQKQLNGMQIPGIGDIMKLLSPDGAASPAQNVSLQLWRMVKIDCYMLQGLIPSEEPTGGVGPKSGKKFSFDDDNPELADKQKQRSFGSFEGCFNAVLSDEEEKINLNQLDLGPLQVRIPLSKMLVTLADKKYEFLFEKEDSNKVKVTPQEIIGAIRDWVDEDEVAAQLNLSGQGDPIVKGFSDEAYRYDRYEPRYKPKNARFDSLDELYMVHGVNDRFMAAFRDKFTVYPDINSKQNINTDDPVLLELAIRAIADPSKPDARLQDPVFIDTLIQKIRAARIVPIIGMSVGDFVTTLTAAGVAVNPTITSNAAGQGFINDKSTTFMIKATGEAGDVTRTLTAVVRLDDGLGRLVYYRED
ncbi:MAG: general secretion pathway protein GspK [Myxococcaceae bacterium]|nr:general secretion pathway protein GspK [Myxococcaceae bacterium]